jgi:hypothetical protein
MPFWSWFSRRPPPAPIPEPVEPDPTPVFTDADRAFVRSALDRFETSGLRIWPELDRELIVARALVDIFRWKADEAASVPSLRALFLALAAGTDSLTWYIDDVQEQYPPLAAMDDDAAEDILEMHSFSIFVNASSINLINEGDAFEDIVRCFAELGDLDVEDVEERAIRNGMLRVSFTISGVGACQFEIENRKRPDVTPLFVEMNRIAKAKGVGRYINVHEGSSESDTFILGDEAMIPAITELLKLESGEAPAGP